MAAVPVVSTAHLHFNDVFLSTYGHLLSYASLTTLLINSTMEGTPSGIKSRYRRQVNKGDLEIALLHVKTPYHKAIWTRKSTSCPFRQSYVHNNEITRDLTALSCSQISWILSWKRLSWFLRCKIANKLDGPLVLSKITRIAYGNFKALFYVAESCWKGSLLFW